MSGCVLFTLREAGIYPAWCSLSFLDLWFDLWHKFCKILYYFLKYFNILLCSLLEFQLHIYCLVLPLSSDVLFQNFLFHLGNFYWHLKVHWFFPWSCQIYWWALRHSASLHCVMKFLAFPFCFLVSLSWNYSSNFTCCLLFCSYL